MTITTNRYQSISRWVYIVLGCTLGSLVYPLRSVLASNASPTAKWATTLIYGALVLVVAISVYVHSRRSQNEQAGVLD